jgi:hypothetical protein
MAIGWQDFPHGKNEGRGYLPQPDLLTIVEDTTKERMEVQGISPLHLVDFTHLEQSVITSDHSFSRLGAFRRSKTFGLLVLKA